MKARFRVEYCYSPYRYVSISEDELPKAMEAQITGGVVHFDEAPLLGSSIIAIRPDFNRMLGLNESWVLTAADYAQLPPGTQRRVVELFKQVEGEVRQRLEEAEFGDGSNLLGN